MIIDNGVKIIEVFVKDKWFFFLIIFVRYSFYQDVDLLKFWELVIIRYFIVYKNQDYGVWLCGGDVWLDSCWFVDNGIGLILVSGGIFLYDDGFK